jgi:hypothetical protein
VRRLRQDKRGRLPAAPRRTAPLRRRHRLSSRAAGADDLADRLDRAVAADVKLLGLTIGERSVCLFVLDDPPEGLAELRGVLMNEHEWRQREGLDPFPE